MFNDLFLKALKNEKVERPPVWLMRQAGRYLPEYQKIRSKVSFLDLCNNPELACEVSIQPYNRFKTDAIIVFSDILLPAEKMGLELDFTEEGPKFLNPVSCEDDIKKLKIPETSEDVYPTLSAINLLKKEIGNKVPIIGFSGAPWTMFCYMTEGKSSTNFYSSKSLLYSNPQAAHQLLSKITSTLFLYLTMQVNAGASAIQIFDTWAGILPQEDYLNFGLSYLKTLITDLLPLKVPIIFYSNNSNHLISKITTLKANVFSFDFRCSLQKVRDNFGNDLGIQGNLDPAILLTNPGVVRKKTKDMISLIKNWDRGYICNLGHGVLPSTPIENVQAMIETVHEFSGEVVKV